MSPDGGTFRLIRVTMHFQVFDVQMPGRGYGEIQVLRARPQFCLKYGGAPVRETARTLPTDQIPESLKMEMNILKKAFLKGDVCSKSELLKDNWGLCWFSNNSPFNKCSIFVPLGKYTTSTWSLWAKITYTTPSRFRTFCDGDKWSGASLLLEAVWRDEVI